MAFYKTCDTYIEIYVRLTPKASRNRIGDIGEDGVLRVYVTAVPEKGKANKALIELLAKALKVPKTQIELVRGETDTRKTLRVPLAADLDGLNQRGG